jgi:arsenical pump membrane protein
MLARPDALLLILAFAYLSLSLDDSGFFNWCSLRIVRAGAGSGRRLLVWLFLGVSLLTFFTSNDIVILTMTPILIYAGRNAEIANLTPYLVCLFVAANTASMGLYTGNPTNILIGDAAGLDFVTYARRMFVPTVVATATTFALIVARFGWLARSNRVPTSYVASPASATVPWTRDMTVKVTIFAACIAFLAAVSHPSLVSGALDLLGWAAADRPTSTRLIAVLSIAFVLVAASYDALIPPSADPRNSFAGRMRRMPFEIVPLFVGLGFLVRTLEALGLTAFATESIAEAFTNGPMVGSLASAALGVVAVNIMNNLSVALLFERLTGGSTDLLGLGERLSVQDPAYSDIFVDATLFACNFGANLTFVGAIAGFLWLRAIRNTSSDATRGVVREFLACGFLIVPVVTLATGLAIGLVRTG